MKKLNTEILKVLQDLEAAALPPLHTLSAAEARETFLALRQAVTPTPVHRVSEHTIHTSNHDIPVRVYQPTDAVQHPAIVWFHGGGWVLGNLDTADQTCRDLALHSGCTVISVDYRLAPESRFPAAFDDSMAATEWAFENSEALQIDEKRIAVGGDSAGGNLAACVAINTLKKDLPVKFQLLVYPVVEARFNTTSYKDNAEGYFLTTTMMEWFWDQYVPQQVDRTDTRVAPIFGDLQNLPPAWLLTAEFDPLRDEGINYGKALAEAGVQLETVHSPDTIHGFFTMDINIGQQMRMTAAKALANALT